MANQHDAEQGILAAQVAANSPPEAGDLCVVTAEGAAVDLPALRGASDPDGDALQIGAVSAPASGRVELDPEGTLTFVPDQPGLQRFTYQMTDGRGGSDTAQVAAFVNPAEGELAQPVLQGLSDQQLARIAMACAGGEALEVERLEGQSIIVPVPAPGERIGALAQPGQQITLRGGEFVGATYLIAEGGLLVLTDDGRMVYVAGLVDAANSEQPPTLRVASGPAVASDALLANLEPIAEPAEGEMVARLPSPEAGPTHWGGANFTPYDPGTIAAGPFPTGPLLPTALGLGTPPVLENAQGLVDDGEGDQGLGNQPPTLSAVPRIVSEGGGIAVTSLFDSAPPFPVLREAVRLSPEEINGVDQRNLTLGQSGDAAIIFGSEFAKNVNTLGVFLVRPNGEMVDPKIVFLKIEQAEGDPNFPGVRPGDGPVSAGQEVRLSDLYDPGQLHPGQKYGLFVIAQGFTLNGDDLSGGLRFASDGRTLLTADGREIAGDVFFTTDPTPGANGNPLNPDGLDHVVSGRLPGHAGLTIGFEDKLLGDGGDNDFNDVVLDVEPSPTVTMFLGGTALVSLDATITDPDDANLSRASVELDGQPDDVLSFDEGSLAGTGVDLTTSTPTSLVFEGAASIQAYHDILEGVVLEASPAAGVRQIVLTVVDERGAESDPFVVSVSGQGTIEGTAGDDPGLLGVPLVDDDIFGRDGNDILFGDSGDDLLDGGPGNDILSGGFGNDELIGGSGADTFVYSAAAEGEDLIRGFNADEGDRLDFRELFGGAADPDDVDPFVHFDTAGNNVLVSVDQDGPDAAFAFVSVATLVNPIGVTDDAQAAADNGALAV